MPNWCENKLVLKHKDRAMLERVVSSVKENGPGLFSEFLPMPKELEGTTAPGDDPNWYDWCCDNWGVKWDVTDVDISEIEDDTVTLWFQTAWSPPMRWLAMMATLGFVFKIAYEEPGMAFYGIFTNASGVRNNNYCIEGSSLYNARTGERNTRKRHVFDKRFDKICLDKAAPDFALPISITAMDSKALKELVKLFVERLAKPEDTAGAHKPESTESPIH